MAAASSNAKKKDESCLQRPHMILELQERISRDLHAAMQMIKANQWRPSFR